MRSLSIYSIFFNKISISNAPAGPGIVVRKTICLEILKTPNASQSGREDFHPAEGGDN